MADSTDGKEYMYQKAPELVAIFFKGATFALWGMKEFIFDEDSRNM